ncbi:ArsR/SmtB family transcription factor [Streptodolium elevatio]
MFTGLADPTRRRILELLAQKGVGTATSLATELPVTRQAVVKHLAVLDRAGLVKAEAVGREVRYRVEPEPLAAAARWMSLRAAEWDRRLSVIKEIAEAPEEGPDVR